MPREPREQRPRSRAARAAAADYRAACKRLDHLARLLRRDPAPNAELVTEAIERVEPEGVRTTDGVLHELDVLVLATGFHADAFMRPMDDHRPRRRRRSTRCGPRGRTRTCRSRSPTSRTSSCSTARTDRSATSRSSRSPSCSSATSCSSIERLRAGRVPRDQRDARRRWRSSRRRGSRRREARSGSPAARAGTSTTAASRRRGRGRSTASARRWPPPDPEAFRTTCRRAGYRPCPWLTTTSTISNATRSRYDGKTRDDLPAGHRVRRSSSSPRCPASHPRSLDFAVGLAGCGCTAALPHLFGDAGRDPNPDVPGRSRIDARRYGAVVYDRPRASVGSSRP